MEVSGIEPPTSCLQGRRSPKLSYTPDFESKLLLDAEHPARELKPCGGPRWSRTTDLTLIRGAL